MRPQLLHNMSSSSRSSVAVRPEPVRQPPPIMARGAKVVGGEILIKLDLLQENLPSEEDERWHKKLLTYCDASASVGIVPAACAKILRNNIDEAVQKVNLLGCATVVRLPAERAGSIEALITNRWLAAAILSKSSDALFIASKRPNLSPLLFTRCLKTFDPRIVALSQVAASDLRKWRTK